MLDFQFQLIFVFYLLLFGFAVKRVATYIRERKFIYEHGCKRPKNIAHVKEPILGLDYLFECLKNAKAGSYIRYSAERFRKYGTTYVTRRLAFDTLHTVDPENLKYMLATAFNSFKLADIRVKAMVPLFGTGIFTTNGAAWAHSRAILRPSFTRQNMTPLLTMMERHFRQLLERIPADGSTFDIQKLFFCFTMDTATEFLMGGSTYTLDPDRHTEAEANFVADYLTCCFEAVRKIAMGPLQIFSFDSAAKGARARACAYVDRFVDEALLKRENRKMKIDLDEDDGAEYNFLEELSAMTTDRTMLRDQVLNVLLASRDTTAALLSNMFNELSRKPDTYAKLRHEVLTRISGDLPTEEEMNNMTYLRWCLNEGKQARNPTNTPCGV
jgi:cytochrome P450